MRHSSFGKGLLGLLAVGLLGGSAASQTPKVLIHEGDTVIGMGALKDLLIPKVNDSGTWILLSDTSFFDITRDGCILRNGFVTLQEGMTLFSPPGGVLDDWESLWLTNNGNIAMTVKLKVGTTAKEGLFWNTLPVAITDGVIDSPLLGANSTWVNFDAVRLTDSNIMFALGDINNTAVGTGTSKERALIRYQIGPAGALLNTTVLGTKSMTVPGLGLPLVNLSTSGSSLAINKLGDFITYVGALGANAIMINFKTVLAQEGLDSPVPGYFWNTLSSLPKVGINDFGEYVYSGSVSGPSNLYVIIKNGGVFALEGDVLPKFSNSPLGRGSAAPFYIANTGDVFWRAAAGTDVAYMRNDEPIIQLNKTSLGGNLVTGLEAADDAFAVSTNGRFWVGRAELQVDGNALIFADFGLVLKIPGCTGNPGKLTLTGGKALVGNHLELALDNGQAPGVLPGILFSSAQRIPGSDCGVNTAYGELLVNPARKVGLVFAPNAWDGVNPSQLSLPIPSDLSLVDATFFAQGFFRGGNPHFTLTNALRIEIGAP